MKTKKYWMILARTQPLILGGKLPIYWLKRVAEQEAKKNGGKVVSVTLFWKETKI